MSKLTKKLSPLQMRLLEAASLYGLGGLRANEEKAATAMAREGLLRFQGVGPTDYSITPAGRAALSPGKE